MVRNLSARPLSERYRCPGPQGDEVIFMLFFLNSWLMNPSRVSGYILAIAPAAEFVLQQV